MGAQSDGRMGAALNLYLERKRGSLLFGMASGTPAAGGSANDPLTPKERADWMAVGGGPFIPGDSAAASTSSATPSPHAGRQVFHVSDCSRRWEPKPVECLTQSMHWAAWTC